MAELGNAFLRHCREKVKFGELSERSLVDYVSTMDRIVRVLRKNTVVEALRPEDFAKLKADISATRGPVSVNNEITRVRAVFNYAKKNLLIKAEVKYGSAFDRPSKKTLRQAKAQNGKRMFTADECRLLIDNAQTPELMAMVLLGLNCGFGNSDCAKLPLDAIDFNRAWIEWPRPKTGVDRSCPLWPETVEALQEVIGRRGPRERLFAAKHDGDGSNLVFLTKFGRSFENDQTTVTAEFGKLLNELGLRKPGRGFYAIRHVFRTIADATRDFPACRAIMGYVDDSMDAVYTEEIDDTRLRAVTDHVRRWLLGEESGKVL